MAALAVGMGLFSCVGPQQNSVQRAAQQRETERLVRAEEQQVREQRALTLAIAEDREALVEAAARALLHSPTAPVPAWLAAIWGPELDDLMVDVLAQIEAPPARAALLPWLRGCPRAQASLRAGAPAR